MKKTFKQFLLEVKDDLDKYMDSYFDDDKVTNQKLMDIYDKSGVGKVSRDTFNKNRRDPVSRENRKKAIAAGVAAPPNTPKWQTRVIKTPTSDENTQKAIDIAKIRTKEILENSIYLSGYLGLYTKIAKEFKGMSGIDADLVKSAIKSVLKQYILSTHVPELIQHYLNNKRKFRDYPNLPEKLNNLYQQVQAGNVPQGYFIEDEQYNELHKKCELLGEQLGIDLRFRKFDSDEMHLVKRFVDQLVVLIDRNPEDKNSQFNRYFTA